MLKVGDIVAVYGETATGNTLHENHPPTPGGIDLITGDILEGLLDNAARFVLCSVLRAPIKASHGYVLVVGALLKQDRPLVVHERQCRLVERDGKKIESRPAKYIARVISGTDSDNEQTGTYNHLESALTFIRNKKDAWDELDEDGDMLSESEWNLWKGIDISSEVDL